MPPAASICISMEVPERGKPVTTMRDSASGGISRRGFELASDRGVHWTAFCSKIEAFRRQRRPGRPPQATGLPRNLMRARKAPMLARGFESPRCFSSRAASRTCASGKFGLKEMAARNASAARSYSFIPANARPSRKWASGS